MYQAKPVKAIYYKFLQKFRLKNKNYEISRGMGNDCAVSEICFVFHLPTLAHPRHSVSYMRYDNDRETRRLTIDLLRYRVKREFPTLDPRNSQCDSWRHLSHLYNANFYEVRGYSESLLFLLNGHAESATNLEFAGYCSEIREAVWKLVVKRQK